MTLLKQYFEKNTKVAIAFSGGTDSAYLLYMAKKCGCDVKAYYVKSFFQPRFELEDANKIVQKLQVPLEVILVDILSDERIKKNCEKRCYYCKTQILTAVIEAARKDGYDVVIDGTNYSDVKSDRPGMVVLQELNVRSPLQECHITKDKVRSESEKVGLFTWNKPAYACLATRFSEGTELTSEGLAKIEQIEKKLWKMGYRDFRVRFEGDSNTAKLQLTKDQMEKAIKERLKILKILGDYGSEVVLDLKPR